MCSVPSHLYPSLYESFSTRFTMNYNIFPVLLLTSFVKGEILKLGPCNFVIQPEPCNTTYLQFYLFTRSNTDNGQVVVFEDGWNNLTYSYYNETLPTKVIIHGFNADMNLFALQDIKNEYLKSDNVNVWMLNWAALVGGPAYCYPAALSNMDHAGRCLSKAVQTLANTSDKLQLHILGFSLGAHVPAVAAKSLIPYRIPRITGLDPAGPGFVILEARDRLSKRAAKFVDVIHTNGLMQGLIEPLGHIDFYMNGGVSQPGCYNGHISDWLNCDHVRAPEYFAESINSKRGFWGWKCNDLFYLIGICTKNGKSPTLAGEHVNMSIRGSYAVETNSNSPYAKGNWQEETVVSVL